MDIQSAVIGPEGGHEAGRRLLKAMYEARYGAPMPPVLRTERGKPYFENSGVHFSISHTKHHVFCVLSDEEVGLDAEETDRDIPLKLAEKVLSPAEKARYDVMTDKREALLRLWVLKEAQAKCTGLGLTGYPDHTDFSPDDPRVSVLDGCYVAVIIGQMPDEMQNA